MTGQGGGRGVGMTAWPRAHDTSCHLEINQQFEREPTKQKLELHPSSSENQHNMEALALPIPLFSAPFPIL